MIKLVYLDPQSRSNLALYDYNLLKELNCKKIFCCSVDYDGPNDNDIKYYKIFSYHRHSSSLIKVISYFFSLLKLIKILKDNQPDIIHIQWWKVWCLDYFFLLIYRLFCQQIVYTAHNIVSHDSGTSLINKYKKYYCRVDKIIVHSINSKDELVNDFHINANKIAVCRHGILNSRFTIQELLLKKNELINKCNIKEKMIFSSLGSQSYYKGTDIIFEAFKGSKILYGNPEVSLIIAGKGNIINNGEKNIIVDNRYISDLEFEAYLELTDVLLLPYRKISQSGVLLTAIEHKIPYISTYIGGISEPLTIANIGWILEELSIIKLREKIENLYMNKIIVKSYKNNVNEWNKIISFYNWKTIANDTLRFYIS